jgi:hypothetical protein
MLRWVFDRHRIGTDCLLGGAAFEAAADAASDELLTGNILQPSAKTIPNGQ